MQFLVVLFYIYFCSLHVSLAAMETLSPIIYISAIGIAFYKKQFIWPQEWLMLAFAGILISAHISFFSNGFPLSLYLDFIGDFRWIPTFIGFLQFHNLFFKKINFSRLLLCAEIVLIIAGFYSIYQFFYGHDFFRSRALFHHIYDGSAYFRPNGFFGLPTSFAYASAMFLCVALAHWNREKKPKSSIERALHRFYFILSSFTIFLTFTRAAWFAFITCTLGTLRLTRKKLFVRIMFVFIIFVAAVYPSSEAFRNRLDSVFHPEYVGNHDRIYLWKAYLNIFKENPFFGMAMDPDGKAIDTHLNELQQPNVIRNHAHSSYINALAKYGIFGFLFFMLFLFINLYSTIRGILKTENQFYKTLYIGILGLQCVLLLGAFTECNFEDLEINHQFILYTALIEYLRHQEFASYLFAKKS